MITAEARGGGKTGGVGGEHAAAHGVVEDVAHDSMDLVHGLGRQAAGSVVATLQEEPSVEVLHRVCADLAKRDGAEGGQDVQAQHPLVALDGRRSQLHPLRGQPVACDEPGEGQPAAGLPAAGPFLASELAGQPFGILPVGACGVPAPPLPPRGRVQTGVDHRVPLLALAGDIALHPNLLHRQSGGGSKPRTRGVDDPVTTTAV